MKWYWIVPLALVGFVVLVAIVGALLPVAHQAACRIRLRQPASAIFAVLADPEGQVAWRPGIRSVEALPARDGRRCYREVSQFGPMDFRVDEVVPDRRLVTRIVTPDSPFGGTWTWRLEPRDDGTTDVTVTENGEVHNVFFRVLSRFVFGHTGTMRSCLTALGARFGESVTVEPGDPDPAPPDPAGTAQAPRGRDPARRRV